MFLAPAQFLQGNWSRNSVVGRGIDAQGTMLPSRVTEQFCYLKGNRCDYRSLME